MGAPEISNCCGFTLKHGTIIIGALQSVFAFMCLILSAAYAVHPHELIEMSDPSVVPKLEILKAMLIMFSVASVLQCVFSVMIVFGAVGNRPALFMPWLIFNPICLFVYEVGTLVAVIHHTSENNAPFIVGHIVASILFSMLVSYLTLTVYSYRQYLKRLNF
ncbi:uncharacterized protein [Euwallacea fornicatus]|uniref:uncharacterized protein n=1 Tax=Euwallacea fornicatus TaxID=995702 RepID=UPI00338E02DD